MMEILNKTKKTVLHQSAEFAVSAWQQMKGFMFSRPGNRCMIFLFLPARAVSMHMFFVFGPIDIIALDGTGRVLAIKEQFRPWTLWHPGIIASAVIELPAGTIAMTKTSLGDTVVLPKLPLKNRDVNLK